MLSRQDQQTGLAEAPQPETRDRRTEQRPENRKQKPEGRSSFNATLYTSPSILTITPLLPDPYHASYQFHQALPTKRNKTCTFSYVKTAHLPPGEHPTHAQPPSQTLKIVTLLSFSRSVFGLSVLFCRNYLSGS